MCVGLEDPHRSISLLSWTERNSGAPILVLTFCFAFNPRREVLFMWRGSCFDCVFFFVCVVCRMEGRRISATSRPGCGRRILAKKRPRVEGFVNSVKKLQRREICSKRDRAFSMNNAQERFRNMRLMVRSFSPSPPLSRPRKEFICM